MAAQDVVDGSRWAARHAPWSALSAPANPKEVFLSKGKAARLAKEEQASENYRVENSAGGCTDHVSRRFGFSYCMWLAY